MNDRSNHVTCCDRRVAPSSHAALALIAAAALACGHARAEHAAAAAATAYHAPDAPALSKTADDREPLAALAHAPLSRQEARGGAKPDRAAAGAEAADSGEHFPHTAIGRALHQHLLVLVDVSAGADERKERSLAQLRKDSKQASEALLAAYRSAAPQDCFGRWLISLTLAELKTDAAYSALHEIAASKVPAGLKDNDREGSALANESAIRQNATDGLAQLARAGNAAAEKDLLEIAANPPSGDDAVRTVAIKGYLAAGRDVDVRTRALKAKLPQRHHDLVTLTVAPQEHVTLPDAVPVQANKGGK